MMPAHTQSQNNPATPLPESTDLLDQFLAETPEVADALKRLTEVPPVDQLNGMGNVLIDTDAVNQFGLDLAPPAQAAGPDQQVALSPPAVDASLFDRLQEQVRSGFDGLSRFGVSSSGNGPMASDFKSEIRTLLRRL